MRNPTPKVDCSRGAPMGRPQSFSERVAEVVADTGPFYLRRVRLNSGGYDCGGAYWGVGAPLYYYEGASGMSGYTRGRTRDDAKRSIRQVCPRATFYGERRS